jgi:multicomponent K+:H+ antiporter subunit E
MKVRLFFPNPLTFAVLVAFWLVLTQHLTVGNFFLAAMLAWLIPLSVNSIRSGAPPVKKPLKFVGFMWMLLGDILISNIVVARQVLGSAERLQPGFVAIPLDLTEALPITLFASTISLTPGTVSIEITEDKKTLYVHVLHVRNEATLIDRIKRRYEKPLKEIFEC